MKKTGVVTGISGPVVTVRPRQPVYMFEVTRVGSSGLLGEVIRIQKSTVYVQVYEDTSGLAYGDEVVFEDDLLSVELGPGLLGGVFDGIGRPLKTLGEDGIFLPRGANLPTIASETVYPFVPALSVGDGVRPGDVMGRVRENANFTASVMFPPAEAPGIVAWRADEGEHYPRETVVRLEDGREFSMVQRWRVRIPRPVSTRLPLEMPLLTGQRILDTLFPIPLGGAAVMPGGFGTGKTVTQQSLAKWCSADVIIYVGCGERGNEMTEVLEEFPELVDPGTGGPLMNRTVLVANTSNMPVAAREASIYLGMTLGEFYRDMGYNVAIMADSTSRWAEALREIGGRLEEMPGEEGYPAYLGSRLAQYYERAGRSQALGSPDRIGSITVVNAVSPAGGDFSEPVTQASLRMSGAFWALDKGLAQQRHFPAINWRQSYTLYDGMLTPWFREALGEEWFSLKAFMKEILEKEQSLLDLVQLVGRDGLSEGDKWTLFLAELYRVLFLQQNAFSPTDASFPLPRQRDLLLVLKKLNDLAEVFLARGGFFDQISEFPLRAELLRLREDAEEDLAERGSDWCAALSEKLASLEVMAG